MGAAAPTGAGVWSVGASILRKVFLERLPSDKDSKVCRGLSDKDRKVCRAHPLLNPSTPLTLYTLAIPRTSKGIWPKLIRRSHARM